MSKTESGKRGREQNEEKKGDRKREVRERGEE